MFPIARPAIATTLIFNFNGFWNEFLYALTLVTKPELATVPLEPRYSENSFEMQLRNFGAVIRGQAPAMNNAEQAVELMEMIDGIYASSELGREVPVA